MRKTILLAIASTIVLTLQAIAEERMVCTLVWEAGSSEPILNEGRCDERISPASTFKIAISLMGFDGGILMNSKSPEWLFQKGYVDWRPEWKEPSDPERWMRYSVVWYSQQITLKLGADRFAAYVHDFGYGNRDISGEPGKDNGLTRAWLSSSLQVSPREQIDFITRMLGGRLPVPASAVTSTKAIMDHRKHPGGWETYGKTGAGLPFGPDGKHLRGQPFGWYVGWAENSGRRVVFARLMRFDEPPERGTPGSIARDSLLDELFAADGPLS